MMGLLELKERCKQIYNRYDTIMNIIGKFLLVLISLSVIGSKIGYMAALKSAPIVILLSLVSAFLPSGLIIAIVCGIIVAHLYELSLELAVVVLMVMLIMFLLYFRFAPKDGIILIIMPVLFIMKIPYVIPICVGLIASPVSVVSVTFGTVLYYIINYTNQNSAVITNFSSEEISSKVNYIITNMLGNREMYLTIVAFAIIIVTVYITKKLSVNYSWSVAILCGGVINLIVFIIGIVAFSITGISVIMLILGTIISIVLSYIVHFFVFSVDYNRTENTQFEDDDYYYYVKAVPKVTVAKEQVNVKKISAGRAKRNRTRR